MSLNDFDVRARKEDEVGYIEWQVRVRAESLGDAVELGNRLFRLAMPDFEPNDFEIGGASWRLERVPSLVGTMLWWCFISAFTRARSLATAGGPSTSPTAGSGHGALTNPEEDGVVVTEDTPRQATCCISFFVAAESS